MNDVKSVKCASKKLMNPKWRDWVNEVPVIISDKQMENDGETNLETGQVILHPKMKTTAICWAAVVFIHELAHVRQVEIRSKDLEDVNTHHGQDFLACVQEILTRCDDIFYEAVVAEVGSPTGCIGAPNCRICPRGVGRPKKVIGKGKRKKLGWRASKVIKRE